MKVKENVYGSVQYLGAWNSFQCSSYIITSEVKRGDISEISYKHQVDERFAVRYFSIVLCLPIIFIMWTKETKQTYEEGNIWKQLLIQDKDMAKQGRNVNIIKIDIWVNICNARKLCLWILFLIKHSG